MNNKIILVCGYCAAGKTTLSHKLSQEINIPCFNKDTIDETICDGFGPESGVFEKGSDDVAFTIMLHITERLLKTGTRCILESVFILDEIKKINALLKKYDGECLLFVLKGDVDVMYNRYVKRDRTGERHWIHKPAYKDWFKNIMPEKFGLEEAEFGRKITVDTTSFEKVNYDDLFVVAKKFVSDT